ncbi:concanavalin A-like lectin/glucanase domain-containing protein [Geopyxis carbonaria]|nr:concanavalin A-like lectin/glucanase domain-containing protein [Geopyxis carbonaria]
MVRLINAVVAGAVSLATAVYAADKIVAECGAGLGNCPSSKPCCSQYGQCGIGGFCLGGCDPKHSATINSCVPAPVCKSKKHTFNTLDRIMDKTKYLGDPSTADWVADGKAMNHDGQLLLTMAPETVGTVLASTTYVWYGKISATLKTSRGKGVVSAFILLSDMKDEVDFEWIGVDLETTQTNYYFQGIPDYDNGGNITLSDTYNNFHTYEIDWTPEQITWSVDGQVGRTLKKSDTYNSTTKVYDYPQTPSRVQLSLWPGGLASNSEGTINWAGGEIDWNSQDIQDNGYYYVTFKDVSVQCYDPPSDAKKTGSKSYIYDNVAGLEGNVVISDKGTILKSFLGSGTNMTADKPKVSSTGTKDTKNTKDDTEEVEEVETVPGSTGAGFGSNSVQENDSGSSNTGSSDTSSSGTSSGSSSSSSSSSNEFSQGSASNSNSSEAANIRVLKGSMLAIVVALAGVMVL